MSDKIAEIRARHEYDEDLLEQGMLSLGHPDPHIDRGILLAEVKRLREALVLHSEVLAAHSGGSPEREWHQGNAWLYPGDRIVVAREPLPPIKVVEGKP